MSTRYRNSYFAYFLMYNFYFLSWSLFSTLISVYMMDKGFKATDVSIVVSVSFLTSMLAQPIIGNLVDRLGLKPVTLVSFVVVILGGIFFMNATSLWALIMGYSLVLTLINGINPVMDMLAAQSPFTFGKIRIWGTIGYALGAQLAGLIYKNIAPQAIFIVFLATMILSVLGVLGIEPAHDRVQKGAQTVEDGSIFSHILTNKTYLFYLLIMLLSSGVTNTGHTYIPSMLEHGGLSVDLASTIVSIAVICESPLIFFSYLFMDKFSSKKLLFVPLVIIALQYLIYSLNCGLSSKIMMTLIAKHAASSLLFMVNLKIVASLIDKKYMVTALALVQTARSLGAIFIQNIAGSLLDNYGYTQMNLFLTAVMILVIILVLLLKIPKGPKYSLFN
ncbi:MFS transporter [Streptococcus massiliensis]|uniref:Putative major facilitator superfamily sugar transporter n=1 Tax=Streptococcus massiliensis TaxID=313439 RepID=A0A380L0C6_9STRE|nr:MFS transporter [Streptococcus massiliensis]SUN76837.1 putative major facilitator superfamily sugar transporter [Streptococcus massiliensis]